MNLRTKCVGIGLIVSLAPVTPGSAGAQDASSASLPAQRSELTESILAAKERALGEPFEATMRASLKSRMEILSLEQLKGMMEQREAADLPALLGSVTSDLVYTPVTPCRAFDSRVSQGGPGPIPANTQRNVVVAGTVGFPAQGGFAAGCGVPVGATAAIINFVTVLPAGPGNIRAWAVADPQPPAPLAAIINYGSVPGLPAIANGVAVPLCNPSATDCTAGDLRLQADTNSTDILGDVVGYFGPAVGNFVDLATAQTVGGSKTFTSPIVGSVTGSAASVTGIVPITNGGTGSVIQNFVDLTTAQTVGGDKTLTGNLVLGVSTATAGNVLKGASRFIHNFGANNTFIGENAGNFAMTGGDNTANGGGTLGANTAGSLNTAIGASALQSNETGSTNTASGARTLFFNTIGGGNTAGGAYALEQNISGVTNTAHGYAALRFNSTGSNNIAVGVAAGQNLTTGDNNIDIGNAGVAAEANTIRIGAAGAHTATFVAGISGATVSGGGVSAVVIDSLGQLGTAPVQTPVNFSGNLAGEVTGTQGATVVSNAASANTANAIVRRDGAGGFSAGTAALSGNLSLPSPSTATTGNILKGSNRFLHNFGTGNTFVGENAGNLNPALVGVGNTGSGQSALQNNTTGSNNSASGHGALFSNTSGNSNTATGHSALYNNLTGGGNVAVGPNALLLNAAGGNNTGLGLSALQGNTAGSNNIALGFNAGANLTTGNSNIAIGNAGVAGEASTIRIGSLQTRAFIAGIRGVTTGVADGIAVLIDSNGQLGTVSSSRRYKDDIADMDAASSGLMRLRPVTFHYKTDQDPSGRRLQYGLIAEEVAQVNPGLVARSADGRVETVLYQFLPPMLLNEVQKQRRIIDAQTSEIASLKQQVAAVTELLKTLADRPGRNLVPQAGGHEPPRR